MYEYNNIYKINLYTTKKKSKNKIDIIYELYVHTTIKKIFNIGLIRRYLT